MIKRIFLIVIILIGIWFFISKNQKAEPITNVNTNITGTTTIKIATTSNARVDTIQQKTAASQTKQPDQNVTTKAECGIQLSVIGGKFNPDKCEIQIISSGVSCDTDLSTCPPQYTVSLEDADKNRDHIISMSLFYISSIENKRYTFTRNESQHTFNGMVLDENSTARNLKEGFIEFKTTREGENSVVFSLVFDNNITMKGSGNLPISRYDAP
jgi:hypothetical protein